jgi:hypothetical protein
MLQARRSSVRILMRSVDFFNSPTLSSHTMVLGLTQHLTETRPNNLAGGKARPARKANNLTVICEVIVYIIWDPVDFHNLL